MNLSTKKSLHLIWPLAFIGTVWLANWLVDKYGAVSVGFGLMAPAGVYAAGLAFTLRDIVHRTFGREIVLACIIAGAGLSWWVSDIQRIAIASLIAFFVSELVDLVVYESALRFGWLKAVVASNIAGVCIDSALFLWIAFSSLAFFWGQVVGKLWITAATVAIVWIGREIRWDRLK